jgi:hypothetical protein
MYSCGLSAGLLPVSAQEFKRRIVMTDQWLQSLFDQYNRKYWDGKLQGWSVRWAGGTTGRPHAASFSPKRVREFEEAFGPQWRARLERLDPMAAACDRRKREITIDVSQKSNKRKLRNSLLHEMCHAATRVRKLQAHGSAWKKEMERIIAAGAPASLRLDFKKYETPRRSTSRIGRRNA